MFEKHMRKMKQREDNWNENSFSLSKHLYNYKNLITTELPMYLNSVGYKLVKSTHRN